MNGDDYRSRLRGLEKQYGAESRPEKAMNDLLHKYGVPTLPPTRANGHGGAWEGYV